MNTALDTVEIFVTDSATRLGSDPAGNVVIAASHGGEYCGYLAARAALRGIILHDAGVGKRGAGIGALAYLDALSIAAATVGFQSARIGDGEDIARRGVISQMNDTASALGCALGQSSRECADLMRAAERVTADVPAQREARFLIRETRGGPRVWGCNSNSLVEKTDGGDIVVTGSHGAALATAPKWAGPKVLAAFFNDAGVGIDGAGVTRLPMLDGFGIAGVTVDAFSARIGDARSTYDEGVISHVNETAAALGAERGMKASRFVDELCKAALL